MNENEQTQMVIESAREHLIPFEIATNPQYEPNWHHRLIAKELENIEQFGDRDYKILVVTVPPRHGKSRQCTIDFPVWYLGRNPEKEVVTASYSSELAQDFGSVARDIVSSEIYKLIFDTTLKQDEKSKAKWKTALLDESNDLVAAGGSYTSVGVGGSLTGRGADILLIDDPIKNREDAESEVYRNRTWNWFTSTAFTRLHPGGVVIIVLTRWHLDDIVGRILENPDLAKRTKIMKFPAVAVQNGGHRNVGEALWDARYPIEALEEIKSTIGPYDWQALYQGSPVLTEKQEFKPQWKKTITEEEVGMMNCRRILTIDTAMSKSSQADYTGFCDNSINSEKFWHIRAWRARLGAEELVQAIFNLYETNHYEKIGIEKTAYLDGLKPYLDSEQRKRGIFLPIVELKHNSTAKEIRIRGLIPRYSAGSIFHVAGRTEALEEEQMQFPFGLHDDVIDAMAYQAQISENISTGVKVHRPKFIGYNRRG